MKSFKQILPILILILFELAVGILLFFKPEEFTQWIIVALGILLLGLGAWNLFRFFADRRQLGVSNWFTLALVIVLLLVGCVLTFVPKLVMSLFAVYAIVYGIFLLIAGVYKIKSFIDLKRYGFPVSVLLLISGILALLLGGLIVLHPFDSVVVLWRFTGVSLIIESISDAVALLLSRNR